MVVWHENATRKVDVQDFQGFARFSARLQNLTTIVEHDVNDIAMFESTGEACEDIASVPCDARC